MRSGIARKWLCGGVAGSLLGALAWAAAPAATPQSGTAAPSDPTNSAATVAVSAQLDELVGEGCAAAGVTPLPRCDDATFLRRVWLDLAGRTPPLKTVQTLDGGRPLDRSQVVADLLDSSEFAHHWGRMWTEDLTDERPFDTQNYDARQLQRYLTEALKKNTPYDTVLAELIQGEGTSDSHGATNFLLRYDVEPGPLAGAVSRKFLGVSLQCAECHDHPHAAWKQQDFWGLAAHFARLRKMTPVNAEEGENFFVVIERPRGEYSVVDKTAPPNDEGEFPEKIVYPQLPGGKRQMGAASRRAALVTWLTDPANPYVDRHVVNVVWERLLGAKLLPNLDTWPLPEPNTESRLLDLLAAEFQATGGDLRRLVTTIALSETYQRAAGEPGNLPSDTEATQPATETTLQQRHWARARLRPLSADQLHLSIATAFGYHYDENDFRIAEATDEEFTYDVPVQSFGETSLTLSRALALYNSDHIRGAVDFGAETMLRLYGEAIGPEHLERLFLSLLARRPTEEELDLFLELGSQTEERGGIEDVTWVVLNSTEFVTNH